MSYTYFDTVLEVNASRCHEYLTALNQFDYLEYYFDVNYMPEKISLSFIANMKNVKDINILKDVKRLNITFNNGKKIKHTIEDKDLAKFTKIISQFYAFKENKNEKIN